MKQPSTLHDFPTDSAHNVAYFPSQSMAELGTPSASHIALASDIASASDMAAGTPKQSAGRSAAARQVGVRTHAIRGVVVLKVAGRLSDVVEDLDRAIQLALAEGPRGVVCDLSGVLAGAEPGSVEVLATAGRHACDWSGIPVAVACPDLRVRAELAAHPLGGRLIVTASVFSAVSMVLVTSTPAHARLRLAPHPTAIRGSREFVTRTLLDWGLEPLIFSTSLVISELVTNSTMQATTDIELSIAWNRRALRLTVRDNSPDLPSQPHTPWDLNGPRSTAVADLSRAFGVLPTADGGKVAWAVLNAAQPRPPTSRRRQPSAVPRESQQITDAGGPAKRSLCAV